MGNIKSSNSTYDQQLTEQLKSYGDWCFDVEALSCKEDERLVITGMEVFKLLKLDDFLKCSKEVFEAWLRSITVLYQKYSNPYHNATHAANVLHDVVYFMEKYAFKSFSDLDRAAAVFAAVVHDVGHPGKTESFLTETKSPILKLFKGEPSPLERYHLSIAFDFTFAKDKNVNVLGKLSYEDRKALRHAVTWMVQATDMRFHIMYVNRFDKAFKQSKVTKLILLETVLKICDLPSQAKEKKFALRDCRTIFEEHFAQTKEEKRLGLKVSQKDFDEENCDVPTTQINFLSSIVDMFKAWHKYYPIQDLANHFRKNKEFWLKVKKDGKKSLADLKELFENSD